MKTIQTSKYVANLLLMFFTTSVLVGCGGEESTNTQNQTNATKTQTSEASSISNQKTNETSSTVSSLPEDAPVYNIAIEKDAYPPFEFQDEYGNYKGYDFDLIRAIGEEAGFKVQMNPLPFAEVLASVERGENDIAISALTISEERLKKFDASNPYIQSASSFVVKSSSGIKDQSQLENKVIATQAASFQYDQLEKAGSYQIKPVETNFLAFQSIFTGKADALLADRTMLFFLSEQFSEHPVNFVPFGEQINLAIFVKKNNIKTLNKVNQGLSAVKENGKYLKLNEKWFGNRAMDVTIN